MTTGDIAYLIIVSILAFPFALFLNILFDYIDRLVLRILEKFT